MAGIKQIFNVKHQAELPTAEKDQAEKTRRELSDADLRKLLRKELLQAGRFNTSASRGDMSRFFH